MYAREIFFKKKVACILSPYGSHHKQAHKKLITKFKHIQKCVSTERYKKFSQLSAPSLWRSTKKLLWSVFYLMAIVIQKAVDWFKWTQFTDEIFLEDKAEDQSVIVREHKSFCFRNLVFSFIHLPLNLWSNQLKILSFETHGFLYKIYINPQLKT